MRKRAKPKTDWTRELLQSIPLYKTIIWVNGTYYDCLIYPQTPGEYKRVEIMNLTRRVEHISIDSLVDGLNRNHLWIID